MAGSRLGALSHDHRGRCLLCKDLHECVSHQAEGSGVTTFTYEVEFSDDEGKTVTPELTT